MTTSPFDALRAALWATLAMPKGGAFAARDALLAPVRAALSAIEDEGANSVDRADRLDELAAEFRAHARATGNELHAISPLFPYGIVGHVDALAERIRFRALSREPPSACGCAVALERGRFDRLDARDFVKTGESDDFCDSCIDYECPRCGRAWRRSDCSTEQHSAWSWGPKT